MSREDFPKGELMLIELTKTDYNEITGSNPTFRRADIVINHKNCIRISAKQSFPSVLFLRNKPTCLWLISVFCLQLIRLQTVSANFRAVSIDFGKDQSIRPMSRRQNHYILWINIKKAIFNHTNKSSTQVNDSVPWPSPPAQRCWHRYG